MIRFAVERLNIPAAPLSENRMFLFQNPGRILCRCFFILLMMAGASGCVTSHLAARRIVEAPNRRDSLGLKSQTAYIWRLTNNPFTPFTLPVGPPAAKAKVGTRTNSAERIVFMAPSHTSKALALTRSLLPLRGGWKYHLHA